MIDGTNIPMKLYTFENQKYQNIKKVLYGEILFNIENGKVYSNIFLDKNPSYHTAAITSMVLKETNNMDLLEEWIHSITKLYDSKKQEPDNLGELLYLISTQEEKNEELISKIEQEAERIAKENPNGYYLYGLTDKEEHDLYQNLWYKLGIEAVGKNYHFDLKEIKEDSYAKTAWWSSVEIKDKKSSLEINANPANSYAERHKLKEGTIILNQNLYALSWDIRTKKTKSTRLKEYNLYMARPNIFALDSLSAAELILLLEE